MPRFCQLSRRRLLSQMRSASSKRSVLFFAPSASNAIFSPGTTPRSRRHMRSDPRSSRDTVPREGSPAPGTQRSSSPRRVSPAILLLLRPLARKTARAMRYPPPSLPTRVPARDVFPLQLAAREQGCTGPQWESQLRRLSSRNEQLQVAKWELGGFFLGRDTAGDIR